MRLSFVILIFLLFTSVLHQVSADTDHSYEKALSAYNEKKFDEAYIHLKNALQQDPENLAAKILMGQVLLINGNTVAAEAEFYEALADGADINLIAEPLGNALLFQNKYEQILQFNDTAKLTGQSKIKWLQIRATACVRINQLDCAIAAYNDSLALDPAHQMSFNGLASVALFTKDTIAADTYLSKALSISDQDPITLRLKGQLAQAQGNNREAIEYYQRSLAMDSNNTVTLRRLADLYLAEDNFDSAQGFMEEILVKTPNDPMAILLSSWLENKDKDTLHSNEKLDMLSEIMSNLTPDNIAEQPELLYIAGLTAFLHGNAEQASNRFSEYLLHRPNDMQAVILLARTFLMTQQEKQAMLVLEKHESALIENVDAALLLGNLYLQQNRAFKAEKLLHQLESRYPGDNKLSLFRVNLMAARGKLNEALAMMDSKYQQNSNNTTFLFTYSMLNLQANGFDKALKGVEQLLTLSPDSAAFYNLKAGIEIRQNNLKEAERSVRRAIDIAPTMFAAQYNLAVILSKQRQLQKSNDIIDELLALVPTHTQTLLLQAHNLLLNEKVTDAQAIYSNILDINPKQTYARTKLTQLLEQNNQLNDALYHIDRLLIDDFDNPEYLLIKSRILIKLNKTDEAKKNIGIAQHFTADNPALLIQQSILQRAIGDFEGGIASLQIAETLQPDNVMISLDKIRMLLDAGRTEEASQLLTSLGPANQDNPNYWVVKAMYAQSMRAPQNAVSQLKQALLLDPMFHQALIMLYDMTMSGIETDFEATAKQVIDASADNVLALNMLAQFYYSRRDFDSAIDIYNTLLTSDRAINKAETLNRMAIMYLDNDLSKATEYSKQAFAIAENNARVLDTYGWIMALSGQFDTALGVLRKAYTRDSDNPEIRYHIGYTLANLGRVQEAKMELTEAVNSTRPFYHRQQANTLLQSL